MFVVLSSAVILLHICLDLLPYAFDHVSHIWSLFVCICFFRMCLVLFLVCVDISLLCVEWFVCVFALFTHVLCFAIRVLSSFLCFLSFPYGFGVFA